MSVSALLPREALLPRSENVPPENPAAQCCPSPKPPPGCSTPVKQVAASPASGGVSTSATDLRTLFEEQHKLTNYFFNNLDIAPVQKLFEACLKCKGTIIFTGVGKSGFVAQKLSQVLVSTGTRSSFLSPQDSMHGDLGSVFPGDLVACFSKSGATEELIKLVPFAKAKGATVISITCVPGSQLDRLCDMAVTLPLLRELCPFALAPVTSCALQMVFGDTLAVALMQAKGLTRDAYAANHPAGRIGKRLVLRVADLMCAGASLPSVPSGTAFTDALIELSSKGCGCVLVTGTHGCLRGIATDGDVRRALQANRGAVVHLVVDDVMTPAPRTCGPHQKAAEAMQAMEEGPAKVSALPVLDEGGTLVGLVTLHALVSAGL